MSCNDKNEGISREEWQSRLETFPFKQDDINKLIMNYLVTGKRDCNIHERSPFPFCYVCFFRNFLLLSSNMSQKYTKIGIMQN